MTDTNPQYVCIYASKNSPGKHDSTGAFTPEALSFQRLHKSLLFAIDNSQTQLSRGKKVVEYLGSLPESSVSTFAYMGHGVPNGLPSAGFDIRPNRGLRLKDFSDALNRVLMPKANVILYACSTAASDTGFACKLAGALGPERQVWAHSTDGHTTENPYLMSVTATTRKYLVDPDSPEWHEWVHTMQDSVSYRLSFWDPAQKA